MSAAVERAINESAYDFERVVWPVIRDALGGGRIVRVEAVTDSEFAEELDTLAGVDVWHVTSGDEGLRGLASRVQWGDRNWRTFTVRRSRRSGHPTEYHKRLLALDGGRGYLYPHLTVQAYVSEKRVGHLLGCAVAYTSDVIELCSESSVRTNRDGSSTFYHVKWDSIRDAGRRLHEYTPELRPDAHDVDTPERH